MMKSKVCINYSNTAITVIIFRLLYKLNHLSLCPFLHSTYLLSRRDSRSVTLHNKTALPVSWRLQGVEELGDEFSVPQDQGLISPNSSFPLSLHFRARRPLHVKKILRLEVE